MCGRKLECAESGPLFDSCCTDTANKTQKQDGRIHFTQWGVVNEWNNQKYWKEKSKLVIPTILSASSAVQLIRGRDWTSCLWFDRGNTIFGPLTLTCTLWALDSSIFWRILSLRYSSYAKGFAMLLTCGHTKEDTVKSKASFLRTTHLKEDLSVCLVINLKMSVNLKLDTVPCDKAWYPWKNHACRLSAEKIPQGETNLQKRKRKTHNEANLLKKEIKIQKRQTFIWNVPVMFPRGWIAETFPLPLPAYFVFNEISRCPLQWLSWNVVQILMVNFKTEDELEWRWRLSSSSAHDVCGNEWNAPTTWLAM